MPHRRPADLPAPVPAGPRCTPPVTGYYSLIYGKTGLERAENDVLAGSDPRLFVRRLADLFTGRDPAGGNVELTLDPAVQQAAMDGLKGVTGAVVALDPTTGAILGLASTPTYDPNQLSSHDPAAIRAYRGASSTRPTRPDANQAISERYSPGSVFKVVVSAAALATGNYTPQTAIPAPDLLTLPGTQHHAGELQRRELQRRRRPAADRRADHLLQHRVRPARHRPRRGQDPGHGRGVRHRRRGLRDAAARSRRARSATSTNDAAAGAVSSIGQQDVQLTPMQAAMIAAAVANEGTLMKPYLVDSGPGARPHGHRQDRPGGDEPADLRRGRRPAHRDDDQRRRTTAPAGRPSIDGVQVAGKTGTAENVRRHDHTWFIGFAPADDPKIAVAVFVSERRRAPAATSPRRSPRPVIQAYLDGQGG